jgi:putative SOS response-associated peptidase YedK
LRESALGVGANVQNGSEAARKAFTLLTTVPGPDVSPVHSRQVVVLKRENWKYLLDLSKPEEQLLSPLPPGSLAVDQVR